MVIIAVVLLLIASPGVAAASMEMTDENCDSNPCQEGTAMPLCCLTADCPLYHCILASTVAGEVLLPNRSTPKEHVYLAWSPTSATTETSLNPKKPFPRGPTQELPSRLRNESHCRNCLNSEEPPLV